MKIINIVATAIMNNPFDLDELEKVLEGSERASSGASWLKMRLPTSGKYTAFYKSGKFLITGATSIEDVLEIAQRIVKILKRAGINGKINDIKIHNVVVSDNVNLEDSLEKIFIKNSELLISYEPEQFPAMVVQGPSCTFLLFNSGKVICTGNKSIEEADSNIKWLKKRIKIM